MEGLIRSIQYPIFGIVWGKHSCSGTELLIVAGGGGSSRSGLSNKVSLVSLKSSRTDDKEELKTTTKNNLKSSDNLLNTTVPVPVTKNKSQLNALFHLTYEKDLVTNVALEPLNGSLLLCGLGAETWAYWINSDCQNATFVGKVKTDFLKDGPLQNCVAFHPTGKSFATGGEDGKVRVWKIPERLTNIKSDETIEEADSTAAVGETSEFKKLLDCDAHTQYITTIDYNGDGTLLASTAKDGKCHIWSTETGKLFTSLVDANAAIPTADPKEKKAGKYVYRSCRFSKFGNMIVTLLTPTRGPSFLKIWSLPNTRMGHSTALGTLNLGRFPPCSMATSVRYIAVGGSDGSVKVFDYALKSIRQVDPAHQLPVTGIAFRPSMLAEEKQQIGQPDLQSELQLMSSSADFSLYFTRGKGPFLTIKMKLIGASIVVLFMFLLLCQLAIQYLLSL